jgi:hypothetical protein
VRVGAVAALVLAACGGAGDPARRDGVSSQADGPDEPAATAAAVPSASASSASATNAPLPPKTITDADDPELRAVLERVSAARRLPIKEHIVFRTLGRAELLAKTRQKMDEEIPPRVLEAQGEAYRALGLAPAGYDFVGGLLKLLQARIAGFYDPDDRAMYLLDDLGSSQEDETLPHELAHALQDQSFSIGPLLHFKEGDTDRLSAIQLLIEGDATSAGFEVTYGNAFAVDESALRAAFLYSTKLSDVGSETPEVLVSSLVSPYTDGFAFVQALRSHDGWRAVDGAFRALPESTEQTLHPEKYFVHEKPLSVSPPTIDALGSGFEIVLADVNGELGLRLVLEQWTARKVAVEAAAGWGGDKYVVAKKAGATPTFAVAFTTRMDTEADAKELAKVVEGAVGGRCKERADFGPLAWKRRGRDVVLTAGPYTLGGGVAASAGTCALADAWVDAIAKAAK